MMFSKCESCEKDNIMPHGQIAELEYGRKRRKIHKDEISDYDKEYRNIHANEISAQRKKKRDIRKKQIEDWKEGKFEDKI